MITRICDCFHTKIPPKSAVLRHFAGDSAIIRPYSRGLGSAHAANARKMSSFSVYAHRSVAVVRGNSALFLQVEVEALYDET